MEYLQTVIAVVSVIIALYALNLQRNEIKRGAQISALIHTSEMIQRKIDYHSKIIDDNKAQGKKWEGHADRINNELRPLHNKINREFIDLAAKYKGILDASEIKTSLNPTRT